MELTNNDYLEFFISAKEVEGCSSKTMKYYKDIIRKLIDSTTKTIKEITTDDIRKYLGDYREQSKCSGATIDNFRRVFSSFFAWLEDEDYIIKSPVRRIHRIKTTDAVKETFTDENIEKMRDYCTNIRDLSIIELLISTGMRVGELVNLDISDINFALLFQFPQGCIVISKQGNSLLY